jgi:octaprenyl-diphosphate synthase
MDTENTVLSNYQEHVKKIDEELKKGLESRIDLIVDIGKHTLLGNGKRLRPLLFVLSCQLCSNFGEEIYRFSTIFEYVHAASLLHDDVLDNAEIRRNKPSVNHVWGNHAAILEGDFMYSKASSIALSSNNSLFMKRLTDTSVQMAEGQIMELSYANNWNISKEEYMEVITAKTAVLISAACACGALISGVEAESGESLAGFGLNMGIAFQLMDDLLDYTSSKEVFGKPVGKDLREGKITLPLIYTLLKLEEPERVKLESLFKSQRTADEDYRNVIELVRRNGALDKIRDEAQAYVNMAASYLSPFPDSPAKESLLELNQYIIERKY